MPETLTRGEAQVVVTDLKKELEAIKNRVKTQKDILPVAVEELKKRQELIEKKLSEILKKGGLITEEDFNESYDLIRNRERKELLDLSKKANKRLIAFGIILLGVVAYYAIKKIKK